jgi:hypothetical protein
MNFVKLQVVPTKYRCFTSNFKAFLSKCIGFVKYEEVLDDILKGIFCSVLFCTEIIDIK